MLTKEQGREMARRMAARQHEALARVQRGESVSAPVQLPEAAVPVEPLDPVLWPKWAKVVALLSRAEDLGVGDTVARVIGKPASAAFKAWYFGIFNKTCGCERRQAQWNTQFPYPQHDQ